MPMANNPSYSQYTIKTEYSMDYYQPTIRPTIQDDRPLPALMNKNNQPNPSHENIQNRYDQDDDEYLDDFEEYDSDNDDAARLTVKASQTQFSEVIDLYKSKLNINDNKKIPLEGNHYIMFKSLISSK